MIKRLESTRGGQIWRTFLVVFFPFLSFAGFPYFKGRLWKASKREEFNNSLSYFL
jgi:hypothetical protein